MNEASLSEWQKEVLAAYSRIKRDTESYSVKVAGLDLVVFPNVFSPKYFTDSLWFAREVPKIVGNKALLEIGTGTGIISLFAALNGAKVTATDINPSAVENAKANFEKYKVNVDVREGNIFCPIKSDEKFDYIFWNHPFNNWSEPVEEILLRAGLDYNYEGLKEYISRAREYLKENGTLLLGTGNFADITAIYKIAQENGYRLQVLAETELLPITNDSKATKVMNKYLIYAFIPESSSDIVPATKSAGRHHHQGEVN